MNQSILDAVLILLAVSVVTVAAFRRFKIPAVLAYLFVGVVVGPHALAWVPHTEDTHFLAEFGIVFLLFTVGLEFSLPQLRAMKKEVLGLGGAQVFLTAIFAAVTAWLLGMSPAGAFVLGGVLAMSSTAIVTKQLSDQSELTSRHGRLSVGILLFQDIAVVPFLILIPALAGTAETSVLLELSWALLKGVLVVGFMLAIGYWPLRPLFHEIASSRSSELFTLTALLFALAAAWFTNFSGLSLALGAFLAGMMLGETEFKDQIEADIRPFRDVLLGLFFVTIGMMLDIHTWASSIHWVLLLVVAMVLFKSLFIIGLGVLFGVSKTEATRTGIILAQGGEFGLVLLVLARNSSVLEEAFVQIVLAAVITSMVLTPALIRYSGVIAKRLGAEAGVGRISKGR